MRSIIRLVVLLLLLAGVPGISNGQSGVSSMSVGAMRAGVLMQPSDIRIEEFINYHRHEIPVPSDGERLKLDTRWQRLPSGKVAFQVGLATPRAIDPEVMRPLNLVLVIDRSGSMSGDRIANVKKSLLAFTECLREKDLVTIVSYSDEARVDLPACRKSSVQQIEKAIKGLRAEGRTNVHEGLMLGYREAKKNFDSERANRVLLLTDGIANVGKTHPETIASDSREYNKQGIDLSTIGLGHDLNRTLLRELADAGRGAIHFVGDSKDIRKTFIDELDSLLSPAADKVVVTIEGQQLDRVAQVYGYEPKTTSTRLKFKLDDMSHGATQVIVGELKKGAETRLEIKVSFTDVVTGKSQSVSDTIDFERKPKRQSESFTKNLVIARMAKSLRKAAELAEKEKWREARERLGKSIQFTKRHFETDADEDISRILKMVKQQRESLGFRVAKKIE